MAAISPDAIAESFAEAVNRGDVDAALSLWADGASLLTSEGEALRGDAVADAVRALVAAGTKLDVRLASMHEGANTAIATGTLTMRAADGSTHSSSSVVVYERGGDGRWRIAIDAPWGLPDAEA